MEKRPIQLPEKRLSKRDKYLAFLESILSDSRSDTARVAAAKILLDETARTMPEDDDIKIVEFNTSGERLPEDKTA